MKILSIFTRKRPSAFSVLITSKFPEQRRKILEESIRDAGEEQRREEEKFKSQSLSLQS